MKKICKGLICMGLAVSFMTGCTQSGKETSTTADGKTKIHVFSTVGVDRNATDGKDYYNTKWLEYAEEKNNISLEFEQAPSTSYKERLQLILASNDYPDVMNFGNHYDSEFVQAVDSGIIVPITDYVKNSENIMKYTNESSLKAMQIKQDGEIYGIPISTMLRQDGYCVRKDWLDKVGLSIPEDGYVTLDEFTEILRRFTYNDPDGNGQNDTYGMAHYIDTEKNFMPAVTMPFNMTGWQESDGEYKYMTPMYDQKSDTYKQVLEYNSKLFKEKLIDPDAPVTDQNGSKTRFSKGIVGVVSCFAGHFFSRVEEIKGVNPNAEVAYIRGIKTNDGKIINTAEFSSGYYTFWAVTSSNKNPEAFVKFIDWCLSDEGWDTVINGIEGISYNVENGEKQYISGHEMGMAKNFARRNKDTDFYIPITKTAAKPYLDMMRENMKYSMDNLQISKDNGYKPEASKTQAYIDAEMKLKQTISKILVGEVSVNEYDKVLNEWYNQGGTEYVKEMNEYIERMNK